MRIHLSELKRLSVETKSGNVLGKIKDIIVEVDGQMIAQYIVKPTMLGRTQYIINRDQIIGVQNKKLIVDDNVGMDKVSEKSDERMPSSPEPIAMRESDV
ncbi:hypothetical protein C0581_04395 [Candidatus Parcubacteria bacterium]|nr:MAG: hypothetical protein C0581_04395 [Candidatus Parcubacteria bacterium]